MNKIVDSKVVYAQSSDIKSRTYLEYRCDMKKKAIAELEIKNWFEEMLKALYDTDNVTLEKSGGDAHIWFLRRGRISGEPDYVAHVDGSKRQFEFQYSSDADLKFYDFKVSKVGKKIKGTRVVHVDREFLYIIKPSNKFAIFTPQWVMQHGKEAGVPAWGNSPAFRVPQDVFNKIFTFDKKLSQVTKMIDIKNKLLDIQLEFIQSKKKNLSDNLQKIIDTNHEFKIIPKTLSGFYETCFLMEQIGKYPTNYSLWLVYGSSFCCGKLNSKEVAGLLYSLDFLYGGANNLEDNTLRAFVDAMQKISVYLTQMQEKNLQTCLDLSPREELVNFLFTVNLYEDIVQELRYLYGIDCFAPINKIFQSIKDIDSIVSKF